MYTYPVVDPIKVGIEALVVPPTTVGDLSTDVATVGGAEALLVVVPAERVLHCPAEARHMETILMLLVVHTAHKRIQRDRREVIEEVQLVSACFVHLCLTLT